MTHSLIIGGTRGLGRALVRLLSSRGDKVSVIGRREPVTKDRELADTRHWVADLLDAASVKKTLDEILAQEPQLNYLIFCQRYRGTDDDWLGEFNVTLSATKAIVESLQESFDPSGDKGIVMVSSVFGDYIGEGQAISYHVGKAGINQMMRYYAVNLGRRSIRVNAVTPFTFLKEESKEFYLKNASLLDLYGKIVPLGRMGTTEDVGQVIAFLCSPQAAFVNGQNIYVDGGLSLTWPETVARGLTGV